MPSPRTRSIGAAMSIALAMASAALPQNLLTNPGFATSLAGWRADHTQPEKYAVAWSPLDAVGSATSGSARITNSEPAGPLNVTPLTQCVPAAGGTIYNLAATAMIPAGQSRSGLFRAFVYWYASPECSGAPVGVTNAVTVTTVGAWISGNLAVTASNGAFGGAVYLGLEKQVGGGTLVAHADSLALTPIGAAPCVPAADTLCLDDHPADKRFRVSVHYDTVQGGGFQGAGHAIGLSSLGVARGGLFWFFAADNPELLVKVLDGCGVNGHYWVFYSAGTNVGFSLNVVDTHNGHMFSRSNPDVHPADPVQATDALPCG